MVWSDQDNPMIGRCLGKPRAVTEGCAAQSEVESPTESRRSDLTRPKLHTVCRRSRLHAKISTDLN